MNIHIIAIGGNAMHNLAIALSDKRYQITGSDDEISEPSLSRLQKKGLLPQTLGWFPEKITSNLNAVILGMHVHEDNPELKKAQELGVKIYSYPEYLYEQAKEKRRVVIAGSHGKTTITSMIMHVLKYCNREFDYSVDSNIEGFDTTVRLSDAAPIALFEGDEYISSTLDKRPKFHLYKPHIAVISGISWNYINVFSTFENYKEQFKSFIDLIEPNGTLFYYQNDDEVINVVDKSRSNIHKVPYAEHPNLMRDNTSYLVTQYGLFKLNVFGKHNIQNVNAAKFACNKLGISDPEFYKAIGSFKGAAKRMQILRSSDTTTFFLDFANTPPKVRATVNALQEQFPERKLITCLELHTFSSLNDKFFDQYANTLSNSEQAIVYYNPEALLHKGLPEINPNRVKAAFSNTSLQVFTSKSELMSYLKSMDMSKSNVLFMSSGNFGGIDLVNFTKELC